MCRPPRSGGEKKGFERKEQHSQLEFGNSPSTIKLNLQALLFE